MNTESGKILTEVFNPINGGGFGEEGSGGVVNTLVTNSNDYGGGTAKFISRSGDNAKIDLGESRGQFGSNFPGQSVSLAVNPSPGIKAQGQDCELSDTISVVQGKGFRRLNLRFAPPLDNEQLNILKLTIIKEGDRVRLSANNQRLNVIGIAKKEHPVKQSEDNNEFIINEELVYNFDSTLDPEPAKAFTVQVEFGH